MTATPLTPIRTQRLAVYGSLRKGLRLHEHYLSGCRMVGTGTTPGTLGPHGWTDSFPVADLDPASESRIVVEVYEPTDPRSFRDVAACIDMEESSGYVAREIIVDLDDGTRCTAIGCHYPHPPANPVATGDWMDYVRRYHR